MLGRSPRLSPVIGAGRLIGLTFAVIAPATSVFLTYGTAYDLAGTRLVFSYAVGAAVNLAIMFCYAELGSRFPEAGGDYALAARSLGRWAGSVYTVLFAVKGVAIPALLALSCAAYLHQLWPGISPPLAAMIIFLLFVALSGLDIRTSSAVVTLMVSVELSVFVLFTIVTAAHIRQSGNVFLRPTAHGPGAGWSWLGAVPAALYGLNGAQASLYYSEEAVASPRRMGRTILGAAVVTVIIELTEVVLGTLALPHIEGIHGGLPLAGVIEQNLGPRAELVIVGGMTVALFDTGVATTMSYARIFYAIARDHQWPPVLNRTMSYITRRQVPIGALLVLAALNLTVLAVSGINLLVTLGGSLLIVIYLGIIAGTVMTRLRRDAPAYAMPFWPWPPLVALFGLILSLARLQQSHLALTGLIMLLGLAWSLVVPSPPEASG
ncbi:MAG: APC family permease [Thermaerobacter sp.]|nr:APC family permease [Thermaerobacter sp.]